ncbi:hypothetical protein MTO96_026402 [Rhipicephalus appendiculatus]
MPTAYVRAPPTASSLHCESSDGEDHAEASNGESSQIPAVDFQEPMEAERELECATDEKRAETSARGGQARTNRLVIGETTTKSDRRLLNTFASEAEQAISQHSARYGLHICLLYVLDKKKHFHGIAYSTEGHPTVHLNATKPYLARRGTLNEMEPEGKYFVAHASRLLEEHSVANKFWEDLSALLQFPVLFS